MRPEGRDFRRGVTTKQLGRRISGSDELHHNGRESEIQEESQ